jgi:hypothetical protein
VKPRRLSRRSAAKADFIGIVAPDAKPAFVSCNLSIDDRPSFLPGAARQADYPRSRIC